MERSWLDTVHLLGFDILLMIIVGLFVVDAADRAVRRWLDGAQARDLRSEAQLAIQSATGAAETVSAGLPPPEPDAPYASPEWVDRLLGSNPPQDARLARAHRPDAVLGRGLAESDLPADREGCCVQSGGG